MTKIDMPEPGWLPAYEAAFLSAGWRLERTYSWRLAADFSKDAHLRKMDVDQVVVVCMEFVKNGTVRHIFLKASGRPCSDRMLGEIVRLNRETMSLANVTLDEDFNAVMRMCL